VLVTVENVPPHLDENDEEDFDMENFPPMLPVPEEPTPLHRGKGRKIDYQSLQEAQPRTIEQSMFDLLGVCTRHNLAETVSCALFGFLQRTVKNAPDYNIACNIALAASPVRPTRLAVCARECLVDRTNWENLPPQDQQERNCGKCDEPLANPNTLKPSKVSLYHEFCMGLP